MDIDDGEFVYNAVIEANDVGTWTSGYWRGQCTGPLSKTKKGYDLHGKWHDQNGVEFSWRVEFKIVEKLPHQIY